MSLAGGGLRDAARWVQRRIGSHALILVYHRVLTLESDPWKISVSPAHFAAQLAVIKRSFRPQPLAELHADLHTGKLRHRSVVVTFDDGYTDNLETALPLLDAAGVPATFFLTSGTLGQQHEFWWDELDRLLLTPGDLPGQFATTIAGNIRHWELAAAAHYSADDAQRTRNWRAWEPAPGPRQEMFYELWAALIGLPAAERQRIIGELQDWAGAGTAPRPNYLTIQPEQVSQFANTPRIEVGAHTVSHAMLASLSRTEQQHEICASKATLETLTGKPITSFAYPFGGPNHLTAETVDLVREAGFARACINISKLTTHRTQPFQLPRLQVHDWDGPTFERELAAWLPEG